MTLETGSTLGHYEILGSLGAGGMGEVYRARDPQLEREVAIKVLPEAFAESEERLARFEREAKALAALNHPNIATVHGFEADGETRFLVMELAPGEDLAERITRGPIPVDEAIPLFIQIAEGLEAAHERGIVHRDLKPANIKVAESGKIKILDFGLAKVVEPRSAASGDPRLSQSPTRTAAATMRGEILGTAAYMSPEQAKGQRVDEQTDVWAFGACLFEALTGARAIRGEDAAELTAAILRGEIDWSSLPAATPPPVRTLLRRCLRADPVRRLRHIGDARLELEEALAAPEEPGSSKPTPVGAGRRLGPMGLALVAGAALASAFFLNAGSRQDAPRAVARSVLSAAPSDPLGFWPSGATDVAISPDGTRVLYLSVSEGSNSLYLRPIDELEGKPLLEISGAHGPFFSPDGAWAGFSLEGSLQKASTLGGPPLALCEVETFVGASWGLDDVIVFADGEGEPGLYRVPAEGGPRQALLRTDVESGEKWFSTPEILPGGNAVLFTVGKNEGSEIAVLDLRTGDRQVVVSAGSHARYVPSGHLVFGLAGNLIAAPFDLEGLGGDGRPNSCSR